ncbi:MAG: DUF971 domain-containing protein [Phycisphaerales bacterium]|nr:DUF971 domain-containing protein [Phycisphaerales bacterium]
MSEPPRSPVQPDDASLPPHAGVDAPTALDLKKDKGLTVRWADGTTSYYSIPYLRRMSPSADMRQLREEMAKNPLTVLPQSSGTGGPLVATGAELVGNYAIKITFSDGHDTGIYSWVYLRGIDPEAPTPRHG